MKEKITKENLILPFKGLSTQDAAMFYCPYVPLTVTKLVIPKLITKIRGNIIVFYNISDEILYRLFDESKHITIIKIKHSKYKNDCIILHTTEESLFYLKLMEII